MNLENYIKDNVLQINKMLLQYIKGNDRTSEAVRYSLNIGGKRIRPLLTLCCYEMCADGKSTESALTVGCAIEMLHTFSLIHDDMPEMDNDDFRRGSASCHKQFDVATALLAGDLLSTFPFEILAEATEKGVIPQECLPKVIKDITHSLGNNGMIGGQQLDIDGGCSDANSLIKMYSMKTGALIKTACRCGIILAGGHDKQLQDITDYAENLGLAFQIIDDILDVESTMEALGKAIGSDNANGKMTYVSVNGIDAARQKAEMLTENALKAISNFGNNDTLVQLTNMLLKRNK